MVGTGDTGVLPWGVDVMRVQRAMHDAFVSGMYLAGAVGGILLFGGALIAFCFVRRQSIVRDTARLESEEVERVGDGRHARLTAMKRRNAASRKEGTMMANTQMIAGYSYGTTAVAPSPVTMEELAQLKQAATFTSEDERWLRRAGAILADQADTMVDTWRAVIGKHPFLAHYSANPDGTPNAQYSAASKPRFAQWIRDTCERPYDQAWLDYQHEIALRHTRAKKNQTDDVESAPYIPLRYLLAFVPVILLTTKPFLENGGDPAADVERMEAAWCKTVLLQVTLWSRAYCDAADW
jgi:hypothetical protein